MSLSNYFYLLIATSIACAGCGEDSGAPIAANQADPGGGSLFDPVFFGILQNRFVSKEDSAPNSKSCALTTSSGPYLMHSSCDQDVTCDFSLDTEAAPNAHMSCSNKLICAYTQTRVLDTATPVPSGVSTVGLPENCQLAMFTVTHTISCNDGTASNILSGDVVDRLCAY